MKNFLSFILVIFSICISPRALEALSIENEGVSSFLDGVSWQDVRIDDDVTGFKAAFPGLSSSNNYENSIYIYSNQDNTSYTILRSIRNPTLTNFQNKQEFLIYLEEQFAEKAAVSIIASEKKPFKYIAELTYFEGNKICRIYYSNTHIYLVLIQGNDFSLASTFFNSIEIEEFKDGLTEQQSENETLIFDGNFFTGSFLECENYLYYIFLHDEKIQIDELEISFENENKTLCVVNYFTDSKNAINTDKGQFQSGALEFCLINNPINQSVYISASCIDSYLNVTEFLPINSKIEEKQASFTLSGMQINFAKKPEIMIYEHEKNAYILAFAKI